MIGRAGKIFIASVVIISIFITLMGWIAIFGITSKPTIAENMTVTLNVNNVLPSVTDVLINDGAGTLTLTQGDSVIVTCNGTLNDTNGVGDIANATADFYNGSVNELSSPVSNRTHYRNNTC